MPMPRLVFFRLCVVISSCLIYSAAQAQHTNKEAEAIEGAMGAMENFMEAFNARDPKGWAASLNYPHVRFASGTVTAWKSAEEFAQTDSFERLQSIGWNYSHWLTRDVILASSDKVHISTVFQRFDADHQPIGTYQSLYIITKVNNHWGIQARSSLAP